MVHHDAAGAAVSERQYVMTHGEYSDYAIEAVVVSPEGDPGIAYHWKAFLKSPEWIATDLDEATWDWAFRSDLMLKHYGVKESPSAEIAFVVFLTRDCGYRKISKSEFYIGYDGRASLDGEVIQKESQQ